MKTVSVAILCGVLAACGGGGGNGNSGTGTNTPAAPAPAPTPAQPAPTLTLSGTTLRTVEGSTPIALTAALSTNGTVRWKLPEGAIGSLSADTGTTVKYTPPPRGLGGPYYVRVTATGDGASATMTLAVDTDPGAPLATVMTGRTNEARIPDQPDTPATFPHARRLAADGLYNIYVLQSDQGGPTVLRKMAMYSGYVETLAGNGTWFGAPDKAGNAARLNHPSGFAADAAGNLYVSTSHDGSPATAAILKITPDGVVSLLAGSEKPASAAIADGTGAGAGFARPAIVGIDPEGNLYVRDANDTPRKVTPAGVVTTLKAFPAYLNADMNGNTYSFDANIKALMRKTPDGRIDAIVNHSNCAEQRPGDSLQAFCLGATVNDIVLLSGASIALLSEDRIIKVTLPKTMPPELTLSSTTLRTIAGGAPVKLTAAKNLVVDESVSWQLADGAPGTLSASSGASVTYTPPATIAAATLVPVVATSNGASARLTLAVTPDLGPAGLTLLAGSKREAREDGIGDQASFLAPMKMTADLAGNVYVHEVFSNQFPTSSPGFILRKITPDGKVTTLIRDDGSATAWFGQPDPGGANYMRLMNPSGMAVDRAGNLYVGQTRGSPRFSAGIMKIAPGGALSLLAGHDNDVLMYDRSKDPLSLKDGVGKAATFRSAYILGIDYDDAMYVRDIANIVRKVTPDGTVTTVTTAPSMPTALDRDMQGNIYAYHQADRTIVRVGSSGSSVVAGSPGCKTLKLGALPGCLPDDLRETIVYGGNAVLLRYDNYIVKLVLPH